MATDSGFFLGFRGDTVPPVDPADVKNVWLMQEDVLAAYPPQPEQQPTLSISLYERACSPGANVYAVFLRVSILRVLQMLNGRHGVSLPRLHDGVPDDAVFRATAAIPMSNPPRGSTTRGEFPFDLEELGRQIEKESETK
jgi:hypothetical protein